VSNDDIIRFFIMKSLCADFINDFERRIKEKQDLIKGNLEKMNKLAEEIRKELGY